MSNQSDTNATATATYKDKISRNSGVFQHQKNPSFYMKQRRLSTTASFRSTSGLTEEDERKKQIMEVYVMCECQRQMHRLSFMYYNTRQFRYNVYPLTVITMLSGVLAFLSTADIIPSDLKDYLSLSVGIPSILSASVQSINQEARYDSKAEMHKNASLGMKRICDQIEFIQVDPQLKIYVDVLNQTDGENGGGDLSTVLEQPEYFDQNIIDENYNNNDDDDEKHAHSHATFRQIYQQCLDSCQSQIPVAISQAFKMAESRLALSLTPQDRAIIKKEFGYMGKQYIHSCLFNEVFCAITDTYFFPMRTPRPQDVVDVAMANVQKCFQHRQITFQRNRETTPLLT